MPAYPIYTPLNAPAPANRDLAALETMLGFVPNVFGVLGGAPSVLEGFIALNRHFSATTLTPREREIVQLAVSVRNSCHYCVAGHSAFAAKLGMTKTEIDALRDGTPFSEARPEALRRFAVMLASGKGHGSEEAYAAFRDAGYTAEQALEVVLGVCVKMISNIAANLTGIPLDEAFRTCRWQPVSNETGTADAA